MTPHCKAACVLASLLVPWAAVLPAGALPLIGDETRIEIASAPELAALGLVTGLAGNASLDGRGDVVLPVTGGDVTIPLLEGSVEHVASGFSISLASGTILDPGPTVILEDLVIDLLDLVVRARVTAGQPFGVATDVPVFDARACVTSTGVDPCLDQDGSILLNGFGLDWTETAAGILNATLFPDLTAPTFLSGDYFGVADLDLRFVPEPSSALLVAAGLLGIARRRLR